MENSFTQVKKSRVSRKAKAAVMIKRITELEILRRAYEIYMETGVPYATEIEGLFEVDGNAEISTEFETSEKKPATWNPAIQL